MFDNLLITHVIINTMSNGKELMNNKKQSIKKSFTLLKSVSPFYSYAQNELSTCEQ